MAGLEDEVGALRGLPRASLPSHDHNAGLVQGGEELATDLECSGAVPPTTRASSAEGRLPEMRTRFRLGSPAAEAGSFVLASRIALCLAVGSLRAS